MDKPTNTNNWKIVAVCLMVAVVILTIGTIDNSIRQKQNQNTNPNDLEAEQEKIKLLLEAAPFGENVLCSIKDDYCIPFVKRNIEDTNEDTGR